MTMQWQQAPIQFNSGINQKTDDKQVVPGQWLVLENLEMQKTGRFKKRRGFTLAGSTYSGIGTTIIDNNTEAQSFPRLSDCSLRCGEFIDLGIKANQNKFSRAVYGYGSGGGYAGYSVDNDAGTAGEFRVRYTNSVHNMESDYKYYNIDLTAGRMSHWVSIAGTATTPAGVVAGLFITGSGVNANIGLIRGSNVWTTLASNVNFSNLSAFNSGDYTFIVYCDKGAGNTKILRYNNGNVLDYQTTLAVNDKQTAVSSNGTYVWVVSDKTLYRYNMDLTGVTNIRTASTGTVVQCAPDGTFITDDGTNALICENRYGHEFTMANLQTANVSPFIVNTNEIYAIFTQRKPSNVADWAGGFLVKRIDNSARVSLGNNGYIDTFNNYDGYIYQGQSTIECGMLFGYMAQFQGLSQPYIGNAPIVTADSVVVAQFSSGTSCYAEVIDRDAAYTTSCLRLFSGGISSSLSTSPESILYGWYYSPVISAVTLGAGTTTLAAGEYQVLAIYEQISSGGNIVRSVASAIVRYTHTVNKDFTVTIKSPTCEGVRLIQGTLSVYIKPAGETVFYAAKTKINIAASTTVTVTTYDEKAVLYTTGGILEDTPPPASVGAPSFAKNRMWVFSAEQPQLRFSDEIFSGELPMFNEAFSLELPPGGGQGEIVKELDGKLISFQKYQISATFGDGPDATGQGGFPPLQIVARDIGSIIPSSVVTTNDGIIFLSSKGLWLLNRGLKLEFIGTGIDDEAANIVCGVKLTDAEQLWFFTATKVCIWDNYHKIWTTAPTGLFSITSAKVINGVLTVVAKATAGATTTSLFTLGASTTDNGAAITVNAKTGWISLGGLKGFERIRRIMFLTDQESATTMTVKLRYNFVDTVAETFTITSADIVDSGGNVQWIMRPKIQKCECFQIEFETSSSGATLELSSIALEYGIKSGLFRVPASKKIGGV